jgi:hypothetical protein
MNYNELVSFGNYLLSEERKNLIKRPKRSKVFHSDLENWINEYNKASCKPS